MSDAEGRWGWGLRLCLGLGLGAGAWGWGALLLPRRAHLIEQLLVAAPLRGKEVGEVVPRLKRKAALQRQPLERGEVHEELLAVLHRLLQCEAGQAATLRLQAAALTPLGCSPTPLGCNPYISRL